jgi:hypothetical protein
MTYRHNFHTYSHPFDSDPPSVTPYEGVYYNVGLLWAANSWVMPTRLTAHDAADHIYYIEDGGTSSNFYDLPVYVGGYGSNYSAYPMTERTSLVSLTSNPNSYFYDSSDNYLYLHFHDGQIADWRSMIYIDGYCDTNIRLGHIDHPEVDLSGNYCLDPSKRILDELTNLATFFRQYGKWRYEDSHTYLDLSVDNGDYASDGVSGLFSIHENDCIEVDDDCGADMPMSAIVGLGAGSRDCRQYYSKQDKWIKGTRQFFDILEISDGYEDVNGTLRQYVDEEYDVRHESIVRTRKVCMGSYAGPRDWVDLDEDDTPVTMQVASILMETEGDDVVDTYELSSRKPVLREAFLTKDRLSNGWMEDYVCEQCDDPTITATVETVTIQDTAHTTCAPYEGSFTIPANSDAADLNWRCTLDITFTNTTIADKGFLWAAINDVTGPGLFFSDYSIPERVYDIDITDYVTVGSSNSLKVYMRQYGEREPAHSSCVDAAHYKITCSPSVHILHRKRIPA